MFFTILAFVMEALKNGSTVFSIYKPTRVLIFFHHLYFTSFSSGCRMDLSRKPDLFFDWSASSMASTHSSKLLSLNQTRVIKVPESSFSAR